MGGAPGRPRHSQRGCRVKASARYQPGLRTHDVLCMTMSYNLCDVSAVELDAGNVQVNSVIRELTVVLLGLHTHCSGVIGRGPLQVCLHRQSWAWLPAAVTV